MADLISRIKTPSNDTYDLRDKYKSGIYTVIGTQSSATGSWVGTLDGVNALYDGLTIMYYLPYNGSGNATLNLTLGSTTTGAVNCYFDGSTKLSTQYGAGSNIILTYYSAGSISIGGTETSDARWIVSGDVAGSGGGGDDHNLADAYDPSATYNIGDYCIYSNDLYFCTTKITTAEAWNSSHWTQVTVTDTFRRVVELTQAQYNALSTDQQHDNTIYCITDAGGGGGGGADSFGNVIVGSTTVAASTPGDDLELVAGTNIVLTPNTTNKSVTVSAELNTGDLYVLQAEHVYTSTSGGETAFDLSTYTETAGFDSSKDTLLVTVDGLTLNDSLYSIVGSVVTLSTALTAGSSISFKVLGFGVRGDVETLTVAYDNLLYYLEAHQPRVDASTKKIIFDELDLSPFAVNIQATSPVYTYAQRFNGLLTYLENNQPYVDTTTNKIIFTPVDLSAYRMFATRVTMDGYTRVTMDGANRTT